MYTLAWMVVGVIQEESINLTKWIAYVQSRAKYAQSTLRRFHRWLHNDRIKVNQLYGPLIKKALEGWDVGKVLYLALDTSMLMGEYCLVRISVVFRGRAVPIVWRVLSHRSSRVSYQVYKQLIDEAYKLVPKGVKVVLLADRGFCDLNLLKHLRRLGWHYRIRIKCNFLLHYRGKCLSADEFHLNPGQAIYLRKVYLTGEKYGPLHVALGWSKDAKEKWYVVSDEPVGVDTFREYGLRSDIEENFLDDKSNGFKLEESRIDSAEGLERLCMVIGVATLYLVSQGIEVVRKGRRREVDPHWFRGLSYLKIGWRWVKKALSMGLRLCKVLRLDGGEDPEPSMASRRDQRRRLKYSFEVVCVLV